MDETTRRSFARLVIQILYQVILIGNKALCTVLVRGGACGSQSVLGPRQRSLCASLPQRDDTEI
jgi:hypothetical protein